MRCWLSALFVASSRLAGVLTGVVLTTAAVVAAGPPAHAAPRGGDTEWTATWEASPEPPRSPLVNLSNHTVRQIVHVSLGGIFVRARLSNEFGDKPLTISAAHIALAGPGGGAIQPGTDRPLTFSGRPAITIPPGARVLSDPARLTVPALSDVAVSFYVPEFDGAVTEDFFALQTGYIAPGDVTGSPDMSGAASITKRVILTGVDVAAAARSKVVVTLGDSLTDGYGSTINANRRWPDFLAARLAARKGSPIGVVNAGIGGNRLLHDFIGPNALSRFDRDVLSQPNVGYLIVLLGINDFGLPGGRNLPGEEVSADDVIAGYRQLIARAHSYGIRIFLATLPPFGPIPDRPGYYSDASEAKREAVNRWIRSTREDEGFVDFEAALRDPKAPNRMLPAYDSGDHLNPNDAGYQAMANAVDFRLFE